MAKSKEELKSLLMKVKEESEKAGLKFSTHGEGNGNPLQYSCPENPMDRGAWWAPQEVHEASRVKTQLSD